MNKCVKSDVFFADVEGEGNIVVIRALVAVLPKLGE